MKVGADGTDVVGTAVVGGRVVGGAAVVGAAVAGRVVGGAAVVGTTVVGAAVVGRKAGVDVVGVTTAESAGFRQLATGTRKIFSQNIDPPSMPMHLPISSKRIMSTHTSRGGHSNRAIRSLGDIDAAALVKVGLAAIHTGQRELGNAGVAGYVGHKQSRRLKTRASASDGNVLFIRTHTN